MHLRQHVDFLIFLVQQILELSNFGFQGTDSLLQRLSVSTRECPSAEFIACLALKAYVGALRAARSDSIASYLLAATAITSLGNPALRIRPNLDNFHRQYSRHFVDRELWSVGVDAADVRPRSGPLSGVGIHSVSTQLVKPIKRPQALVERQS